MNEYYLSLIDTPEKIEYLPNQSILKHYHINRSIDLLSLSCNEDIRLILRYTDENIPSIEGVYHYIEDVNYIFRLRLIGNKHGITTVTYKYDSFVTYCKYQFIYKYYDMSFIYKPESTYLYFDVTGVSVYHNHSEIYKSKKINELHNILSSTIDIYKIDVLDVVISSLYRKL